MILKIGISGKRQIGEDETGKVKCKIEAAIWKLLNEYKTIDFVGYTSLAEGADTIFADVVVNVFKKPLHIVLPFSEAGYKKDFQDPVALNIFEGYIKEHGIAKIATPVLPTDKEERNQGYFNAGKFIADQCNEMIFVWDGLKPEGHGGTAEIMGYHAIKKEKKDFTYIAVTPMPTVRDRLQEKLFKEFNRSDGIANDSKKQYKEVWWTSICFGWVVVLCFAIKVVFLSGHDKSNELPELLLTAIELLMVVVVFGMIAHAKKKKYHGTYLFQRQKSETLRLLRYFYYTSISVTQSPDVANSDKAVTDLVNKINEKLQSTHYRSKWFIAFKIRKLINDQLKYHSGKIKDIGYKPGIYEYIKKIVSYAFLLNLSLHLLNSLNNVLKLGVLCYEYPHGLTVFLSLMLPATYAAIEGILFYNEWATLKGYSESAMVSLTECLEQLPEDMHDVDDKECQDIQYRVLNLTASVMLTDNKNWNMIFEDKEEYRHLI
jgi:hypothetical protein